MNKKYGRRENIRKQNIIRAEKRKLRITAYISLTLFIIINSVFFSCFTWTFFQKDYVNFVPFGLIIFDSILVGKVLKGFIPSPNPLAFSLLSFFLFLIILVVYHRQLKNSELKLYGREIYGLVNNKHWHRVRSAGNWEISAKFKVGNKYYSTFSEEDKDESFEIGDTIKLIYSIRNPEISELIKTEN